MNTEIQEEINLLIERETHSDTMRPLSLLEQQWLKDYRDHFETMYAAYNTQVIK